MPSMPSLQKVVNTIQLAAIAGSTAVAAMHPNPIASAVGTVVSSGLVANLVLQGVIKSKSLRAGATAAAAGFGYFSANSVAIASFVVATGKLIFKRAEPKASSAPSIPASFSLLKEITTEAPTEEMLEQKHNDEQELKEEETPIAPKSSSSEISLRPEIQRASELLSSLEESLENSGLSVSLSSSAPSLSSSSASSSAIADSTISTESLSLLPLASSANVDSITAEDVLRFAASEDANEVSNSASLSQSFTITESASPFSAAPSKNKRKDIDDSAPVQEPKEKKQKSRTEASESASSTEVSSSKKKGKRKTAEPATNSPPVSSRTRKRGKNANN